MPKWEGKFNLEDRTAKFGEAVIELSKIIPKNDTTRPLINQIVRSGTSVGANYCEADCAESKKILNIKLEFVKKNQKKQNIG